MITLSIGVMAACSAASITANEPVDYVSPYIGNISHLLVPTFPTVHLPNSMLRVYPERSDYTSDKIKGLPVVVTNHREKSAFNLTPFQGEQDQLRPVVAYTYDNEELKPYSYSVYLDEPGIEVKFAPSHQSAVYEFKMNPNEPASIIVNSKKGSLTAENNCIHGYQELDNNVRIYLYMESLL